MFCDMRYLTIILQLQHSPKIIKALNYPKEIAKYISHSINARVLWDVLPGDASLDSLFSKSESRTVCVLAVLRLELCGRSLSANSEAVWSQLRRFAMQGKLKYRVLKKEGITILRFDDMIRCD